MFFKHLRRSEIQDRTLADGFKHLRRAEIHDPNTCRWSLNTLRRAEIQNRSLSCYAAL